MQIWQYTGHQSLRLHHSSIFVRLHASHQRTVPRRRPITHGGPVLHSLSPARRRRIHCLNVYLCPFIEHFCFGRQLRTFLFSKYYCMQCIRGFGDDALCKYTFCIQWHYIKTWFRVQLSMQHAAIITGFLTFIAARCM